MDKIIITHGKPFRLSNAMGSVLVTAEDIRVSGIMDVHIMEDENEVAFFKAIGQLNESGMERARGLLDGLLASEEFRKK